MPDSDSKEATIDNQDSTNDIQEDPIDDAVLKNLCKQIGMGMRRRVINCLIRNTDAVEKQEKDSQMLELYNKVVSHPFFYEGTIDMSDMGKPTLFALELYLYIKGLIQERRFEQILREKTKNWKNKPAYLDVNDVI